MPRAPEAADVVRACLDVGFLVRKELADLLAPHGITPEQQEVLALLAAGKSAASEVCEATGRDKTTLSRVFQRLVRAGLVVQEKRADDRRRHALRLTPRGEAIAEQTARALAGAAPKVVAALSAKERRRIAKIARKLRGELG